MIGVFAVVTMVPMGGRLTSLSSSSSMERSPASIEKVWDFSYLEDGALAAAAKKRMATSLSVEMTAQNGEAKIQIGNFVLNNIEEKRKDFACGYYDRVVFVFEAEGIATSGERPEWLLEAGCQIAGDVNDLLPIHIPVNKIKAEKPGDVELKYYDGSNALSVSFNHMPPRQWPTQWVLKEVSFKHSQYSSRVLKIDSDELRGWNQKPVVMFW